MDAKKCEDMTEIATKILSANGYTHEGNIVDYVEALEMLVNALAHGQEYIKQQENMEPFTYIE